MSTKLHQRFQEVVEAADLAGHKAVEDLTPTPMVVYTPADPVASMLGGDDGGPDPDEPVYYVEDGVCGFAWVNCKAKATEGRKFLNWLKGATKTARPVSVAFGIGITDDSGEWPDQAWQRAAVNKPRPDSYYGGVSVWISGFQQSMQKKEAYGRAFARVLNEGGIDGLTAYCGSRLD